MIPQCGAATARSNSFQYPYDRHPIARPWGRGIGSAGVASDALETWFPDLQTVSLFHVARRWQSVPCCQFYHNYEVELSI